MIQIQLVEHEDLLNLIDLFDAYRIFYRQESDKLAAKSFWEARFEARDFIAYIAKNDAEVVGFVNCYFQLSSVRMEPYILLNDLFVVPSFRNQGIGKMLLDQVKVYAHENDYFGIQLETEANNQEGNYLYPKEGFKRVLNNFYFWLVQD